MRDPEKRIEWYEDLQGITILLEHSEDDLDMPPERAAQYIPLVEKMLADLRQLASEDGDEPWRIASR